MDTLISGAHDVAVLASDMELGFSVKHYLGNLVAHHGTAVYMVLFAIIFAETGLIIFPFLPGDSLLFVAGATWAASDLEFVPLCAVLISAAFLGDNFNYWMGRYLGPRFFMDKLHLFKKEHLDYTHNFLEKHGGKTLIVSRFIAFARTYAPFMAGASNMNYPHFMLYSLLGAHLWVLSLTSLGYMFGNIPIVEKSLHWIMLVVLFGALTVLFAPYLKKKWQQRKQAKVKAPE